MMGAEVEFITKYGPVGILILASLGLLHAARFVMPKVVDACSLLFHRALQVADKMEAALDALRVLLAEQEAAAERRHSETREHTETCAKETRHAIRQDVTSMQLTLEGKIDSLRDDVLDRRARRRLAPAGAIDVEPEG